MDGMLPIFYFRGLNTYGDDLLHLGPLKIGKMYGPLQEQFRRIERELIPVNNLYTGSFSETLDNAKRSLLSDERWASSRAVHFLGHSMGALIARALLHDPDLKGKVKSLISYGTPHRGAEAASSALSMGKTKKFFLDALGWSPQKRLRMVEHLTPQAMEGFNLLYTDLPEVRYASAPCHANYEELCLPMKWLAGLTRQKERMAEEPHDGLISLESQKHGEILGQFRLDHIAQLGYFLYPGEKQRWAREEEFLRLLDAFVDFWEDTESR